MWDACVRFFYIVACGVGLWACGFPRPADVGDDAGIVDGGPVDGAVPAPTVATVTPDWGSMSGGTHVTLTGSGFMGAHLVVKFGARSDGLVTVVSDTELTVTTPAGPHMPVTVAVTTDGGTASAAIRFRYLEVARLER